MSRQSTWIKGSQGCVAPLPFLSLGAWECFLSLATASSCARMGCVTHHSSAQRDGTPQALGVWGTHPRQSNSLQTSAMQCQGLMLRVALPQHRKLPGLRQSLKSPVMLVPTGTSKAAPVTCY